MGRMAGWLASDAAQPAREIAQLETSHLVFQRAERDTEIASGRGHVPVGLLERAENEVALEGVAGLLEQRLAGRRAGVQLGEVVLHREVLVADPLLVADRDESLDEVLELPDVARPPVRGQDFYRRIRDPEHRLPELDPVALEKQPGQFRQVVEAFAERRHPNGDDVDPVVQVLAEPPLFGRLLDVDVGGHHQPEAGPNRLGAADPLDFPFLNGPQQLGLEIQAEVPDLVQEERAARCELELPELLLVRTGERAALVAEQRALYQLVRDRGQVYGDERRVAPAGLAMEQARQQLFAGTALAQNQHRGRQLRDLVHQVHDLPDLPARTDQELALSLGHLGAQHRHLAVEIL